MKEIDNFLEMMEEMNPHAQYPSDMTEAIIGYVERFDMAPLILLDREKCIDILMRDSDMSYEDVIEYFEFNTIGSWVGEGTPFFATLIKKGEIK